MTCVVVCTGLGYWSSSDDLEALRWLDGLPEARVAAPLPGKAVYRGEVVGPSGRRSPLGRESAAFWWDVEYRHKGNRRPICSGLAQSELFLREGASSASLAFLEPMRSPALAITSDDRSWSYDYSPASVLIDLAALPEEELTQGFPGELARCAGERHHYAESQLPQSALVELAACSAGGQLRACDGRFGAVLSVGGLSAHRARRIDDALLGLGMVGGLVAVVLLVTIAVLARWRDSVLRALSATPGGGTR